MTPEQIVDFAASLDFSVDGSRHALLIALEALESTEIERLRADRDALRAKVERLRADLNAARSVIGECAKALSEELAAWDIDPPIAHVQRALAQCNEWLERRSAAPLPPAQEGEA